MKHSILVVILLSEALAACGGGGSSPSTPVLSVAPVVVSVPTIGDKPSKPFTGAFMAIEGKAVGFVAGTSPEGAVKALAQLVVNDPVAYAPLYQLLLSDKGLRITVYGESLGTGSVSGLPVYGPDVVYFVRLTSAGLIVTN